MYENGSWSPLAAFSSQFQSSPPILFATLRFRGFSGVKIALLLYGVPSAQAGIETSVKLDSDRLSLPWWELFGGLDVSFAVVNALLSHGMASVDQPVIHDEVLLAQSPPRPSIQSQMVTVPGGAFKMGCDALHNGGYGCLSREVPLHTVLLDTFLIDKYEVTNADYAQCVNNGYCTLTITSSKTRPSYYGNPAFDNYPKIYVTWSEANDYCFWAGKRLPTEAEWEKAARGDKDTRAFPWGDSIPDCSIANYATVPVCVGDTNQVGSYPAGESPYGALDMAGNVAEWVNDWYQADYYTGSPSSNPPGPVSGTTKVNRGGSYGVLSEYVRIAFRNYYLPDSRNSMTGFRCAAAP
jgi:formylglycine-generating enzyme required for sulfatase activity